MQILDIKFKKIITLFLGFYILSLFQTSFLVHFCFVAGEWGLNIISISVIIINLLEKPNESLGVFAAIWGGFFWDMFSSNLIGFHILFLVLISILIKTILKRYVRFPIEKRF